MVIGLQRFEFESPYFCVLGGSIFCYTFLFCFNLYNGLVVATGLYILLNINS